MRGSGVAVTDDGKHVDVGACCLPKIIAAAPAGFELPEGGPILHPIEVGVRTVGFGVGHTRTAMSLPQPPPGTAPVLDAVVAKLTADREREIAWRVLFHDDDVLAETRGWLSQIALPKGTAMHGEAIMVAHAWQLVKSLNVNGSPAVVDKIIGELERHRFVKRLKRELAYSPDILGFGVGGMSGKQLERADYPCLFSWTGTQRLHVFWHWWCRLSPSYVRNDLPYALAEWPGIHPSKERAA